MLTYPPRLSLAALPTPLTRLDRYSARFPNTTIWVKRDELTGMEVSGNKIRKLEFSFAEAKQQGCDTIITCGGIQSNHCRATAVMGARLGFKVHLILRGDKPDKAEGNLLMDYLAGATVTYLADAEYHTHEQLAEELSGIYASAERKAFFIPIGASDEVGLWGYIAASQELQQDFEAQNLSPDYILCATGSGGTQGGLILGSSIYGINAKVKAVNVSDNAAYFEKKVRDDFDLWNARYKQNVDTDKLQIDTIEGYLGPGYGRADPEVFATIADLAKTEGLFLDPVYTGKAFHGMISELDKGAAGHLPAAKNIVFVHTGGIFGVFPQGESFSVL